MCAVSESLAESPSRLSPADYALAGCLTAVCIGLSIWLLAPGGWPETVIPSLPIRAGLVALMAIMIGGFIQKRLSAAAEWAMGTSHLTSPAEFQATGVGPLPADTSAKSLYLDLVKRTVTNLIYEDRPTIFYDHNLDPVVADRYRLERRILGEDCPLEAHTMVGLHRLNNLQACVEKLLAERIPGDLLEAGVFRGGASIFLRALLKAHHCTDRQVFACDTFRVLQATKPSLVLDFILSSALACISWIPSPALHRAVVIGLHRRIKPEMRSFPLFEDPSPALIKLVLFQMRYARGPVINATKDQTGVEAVRSHFAAYGLLDDQVQFLEGFFSDTLPTAPVDQLALIRLDGDLYESTMDILNPLYPKLSKGGYCIVDDYHAFPDCRRAVDEYRAKHGITEELIPIDHIAVYWRKS